MDRQEAIGKFLTGIKISSKQVDALTKLLSLEEDVERIGFISPNINCYGRPYKPVISVDIHLKGPNFSSLGEFKIYLESKKLPTDSAGRSEKHAEYGIAAEYNLSLDEVYAHFWGPKPSTRLSH